MGLFKKKETQGGGNPGTSVTVGSGRGQASMEQVLQSLSFELGALNAGRSQALLIEDGDTVPQVYRIAQRVGYNQLQTQLAEQMLAEKTFGVTPPLLAEFRNQQEQQRIQAILDARPIGQKITEGITQFGLSIITAPVRAVRAVGDDISDLADFEPPNHW